MVIPRTCEWPCWTRNFLKMAMASSCGSMVYRSMTSKVQNCVVGFSRPRLTYVSRRRMKWTPSMKVVCETYLWNRGRISVSNIFDIPVVGALIDDTIGRNGVSFCDMFKEENATYPSRSILPCVVSAQSIGKPVGPSRDWASFLCVAIVWFASSHGDRSRDGRSCERFPSTDPMIVPRRLSCFVDATTTGSQCTQGYGRERDIDIDILLLNKSKVQSSKDISHLLLRDSRAR